ncbi:MAG: GDP-L-fucose synthase [Candidatus Peribacteraceae bacterium]|nr:GDP-L-fucose synthase [Candidatus Peribacteraceae bacterium]
MKKKVLITGGHGMLGTLVRERLSEREWVGEVIAPKSTECDLRDQGATRALFWAVKPAIVVHCAGNVGGIGYAKDHPGEFFYDNLMVGINALHVSHEVSVEKFVGIGSVCAYPEFASIPLKEETLWDGYPQEVNAPYGIAKKAMLVAGQTYREQYGFHAIHLLLVNLYGPGDKFDPVRSHVIAALIRKFSEAVERNEATVTLWGDGTPTREFLFAGDAADAIVLATERYDEPAPVNIGSGQEISIKDLAVLIARETGYKGKIVWDTSKPNGQPRRCLDTMKAKEKFGFKANISLQDGIKQTVVWYRKHLASLR